MLFILQQGNLLPKFTLWLLITLHNLSMHFKVSILSVVSVLLQKTFTWEKCFKLTVLETFTC